MNVCMSHIDSKHPFTSSDKLAHVFSENSTDAILWEQQFHAAVDTVRVMIWLTLSTVIWRFAWALRDAAEVMKVYKLHPYNSASEFQDVSHISGRECGKSGLGLLWKSRRWRRYLWKISLRQLTICNPTHAIDFAGAWIKHLWVSLVSGFVMCFSHQCHSRGGELCAHGCQCYPVATCICFCCCKKGHVYSCIVGFLCFIT